MNHKYSPRQLLATLGGVITLLLAFLTMNSFVSSVSANETKIAEHNLMVSSNNAKFVIEKTFETYHNTLDTAALLVEEYADFKDADVLALLNNIAKLNGYERIAVDFFDGTSYTSDGHVVDVSKFNYLDRIRRGERFITEVLFAIVDNKPGVSFFVPLHNQAGAPVASLRLTLGTEQLSQALKISLFNREGYYHLVDANGLYVSASQTKKAVLMEMNFFEAIAMLKYDKGYSQQTILNTFQQKSSGYVRYSAENIERYAYCEPAGINDWALLTIVPKEVISAQAQQNIYFAVLMAASLGVLFLLIFLYIYFTQRRAALIAMLNDKCFRVLAEQTGKIIFEWDFEANSITSMTNFKSVFGREMATSSSAADALSTEMVHPEDGAVFSGVFEEILKGNNVENARFRILHANGEYRWCLLSGAVVEDQNGKPYKAIGTLEDIHDTILKEESLRQKSERDQLTGLYNKVTTEHLIRQALLTNRTKERSCALMILDLDHFKGVNDLLGHQWGDSVLVEVAEVLRATFHEGDILGRIGGDEFFVLLGECSTPDLPLQKAKEICSRMRREIEQNGVVCPISASIGLAVFPEHGDDLDQLYRHADMALYRSKENGRNSVTVYDGSRIGGYTPSLTKIDEML